MATKSRKSAASAASPTRRKAIDWDAVERDYRTSKFTLRELAEKHSITHTTIARKAEKLGWTKDLTDAIRQATNSKLVQQAVQQICTSAHQNATDAVLIAAEVNTRIIQSHRVRIASLQDAVETAKHKLMELGDTVADIREAATFVQAVGNLANATKTLIEQERKAHGLDDDATDDTKPIKRVLLDFVDVTPK